MPDRRARQSSYLLFCLGVMALGLSAAFIFGLRGWQTILLAVGPAALVCAEALVLALGSRKRARRKSRIRN